jgi:hypothetical protein
MMGSWPVFVSSWQQECCGEPFALGDEVAWKLVLIDAENRDWPWPDRLLADIDAVVVGASTTDDGHDGVIVLAHGMSVWWPGERHKGESFAVRGLFLEEHHGGVPFEMPAVRGRVERIRLVTQPYRRVQDNEWEPAAGDWELDDILRAPERFESDLRAGADTGLVQAGLMIGLLPL